MSNTREPFMLRGCFAGWLPTNASKFFSSRNTWCEEDIWLSRFISINPRTISGLEGWKTGQGILFVSGVGDCLPERGRGGVEVWLWKSLEDSLLMVVRIRHLLSCKLIDRQVSPMNLCQLASEPEPTIISIMRSYAIWTAVNCGCATKRPTHRLNYDVLILCTSLVLSHYILISE